MKLKTDRNQKMKLKWREKRKLQLTIKTWNKNIRERKYNVINGNKQCELNKHNIE